MSNLEPNTNLEDVTDLIDVGPTFPTGLNNEKTDPIFPEVQNNDDDVNISEVQDDNDVADNDGEDNDVADDGGEDDGDDGGEDDGDDGGEDDGEDDSDDDDDADDDDADDNDADDDDADDDEDKNDNIKIGDVVDDDNNETKISDVSPIISSSFGDDTEDDDTEDEDEDYLQKLDKEVRENFLADYHPESHAHNYEEVKNLAKVTRNKNGQVIDMLHRTLPFLTKYEKTRILGQRAKQIDTGAKSFIKTENNVIDGYLIAQSELEQKKIPFIIKRPLPNGGFEYWNISDLELIH